MPTPDEMSVAARQAVAGQLYPFVQPHAAPGGAANEAMLIPVDNAKLAESFALVAVNISQVLAPPKDVVGLLQPGGAWIHLVHSGKMPTHVAFSRVKSFDADAQKVVASFEGGLAGQMDKAIQWVDANHTDVHAVVRVATFPGYFVYAFVFLRGKKASAVLIDQPASFKQLKYEKEYPLKGFLTRLAKEPHT